MIGVTLPNNNDAVDSVSLIIPFEYHLQYSRNANSGLIYYVYNGNRVMTPPRDFIVTDRRSRTMAFQLLPSSDGTMPKAIDIINRKLYISKDYAAQLLKQYNPSAHIDEIKTRTDTLKLLPYSQFRKEHPEFIASMRKIPDSIILSVGLKGGKTELIKKEIKW